MRKFLLVLMCLIIGTISTFSIESDFKNSLLKVDFVQTGTDSYNIQLYTQKPYSEPVKVIKKSETNYYLLLPETFHSISSVIPLGDIKSADVKLFPYAGQDLNNGYTKINIYTSKPVTFRPTLKTASNAVAPQIDTKKLSQLDSAFNTNLAKVQEQQRIQAQQEAARAEAQRKAQAAKEAALKAQQAREAAQKAAEQKARIEAQKAAQAKAAQEAKRQEMLKQEAQRKAAAAKEAALKAQQEATRQKALKEQQAREAAQKQAAAKKAQPVQNIPGSVQKKTSPAPKTATQISPAPSAAPSIPKETTPQTPDFAAQQEQTPQEQAQEAPSDIITEEIEQTSEPETPLPALDVQTNGQKNSLINKIKRKLSPLKPYYYIIIDNSVLAVSALVAALGIILLAITSRNKKKKGAKKAMENNNIFEDNTEKSDLEALGGISDSDGNNFRASDEAQSFKDEFRDLAMDNEAQIVSQVEVQTIEIEQTEIEAEAQVEEPYVAPSVLSSVEIAPGRGFMIVEQEGKKALFGYIGDDVFLLYSFREYFSNYEIKFRISEKQDDKTFFILRVDKVKLLVRVSRNSMKLELEM